MADGKSRVINANTEPAVDSLAASPPQAIVRMHSTAKESTLFLIFFLPLRTFRNVRMVLAHPSPRKRQWMSPTRFRGLSLNVASFAFSRFHQSALWLLFRGFGIESPPARPRGTLSQPDIPKDPGGRRDPVNRDVRTVQRWEAVAGLPVDRLDKSGPPIDPGDTTRRSATVQPTSQLVE